MKKKYYILLVISIILYNCTWYNDTKVEYKETFNDTVNFSKVIRLGNATSYIDSIDNFGSDSVVIWIDGERFNLTTANAAGNNYEIQFNLSGNLSTDSDFKYNNDTLFIPKNLKFKLGSYLYEFSKDYLVTTSDVALLSLTATNDITTLLGEIYGKELRPPDYSGLGDARIGVNKDSISIYKKLWIEDTIICSTINSFNDTLFINGGTNLITRIGVQPVGSPYIPIMDFFSGYTTNYLDAYFDANIVLNNGSITIPDEQVYGFDNTNTGFWGNSFENRSVLLAGGDSIVMVYEDSILFNNKLKYWNYTNTPKEFNLFLDPTTGEITADELTHAYYYFEDSSTTISLSVQNTWYKLTNAWNNILINPEFHNITISNDTITVGVTGHYRFTLNAYGEGSNAQTYQARIYNITDAVGVPGRSRNTGRGAGNDIPLSSTAYCIDCTAGDKLVIQIRNISGTGNFTVKDLDLLIELTHAE